MQYIKKTQIKQQVMPGFLALSILILTSACGQNQIISDVTARSYLDDDGASNVELKTIWNAGQIMIPSVTLPIVNPKNFDKKYGTLKVQQLIPSGLEVSVNLNLSEVGDVDDEDALLPNGTTIPINGMGTTAILGFPVKDTGAKIYLALNEGIAVLGFAIPIREFDAIGKKTGQANLFLPFSFSKFRGTGGIFAGPDLGETGLALFVDVGPAIEQIDGPFLAESALASSQKGRRRRAVFKEQLMSEKSDEALRKGLYKLHKRHATVHMH